VRRGVEGIMWQLSTLEARLAAQSGSPRARFIESKRN
jgi:hypothetical protein